MKAYIFLADGFEEVEALTTADLLIRAGIDTVLVMVPGGTEDMKANCKGVRGSHNIYIKPDRTLNRDISVSDFNDGDCVVLPGGMPGTRNLAENMDVIKVINSFNDSGKIVAAICAAPSVLGISGLLKGKQATCFPGFEDKLLGAIVKNTGAVSDGNIVTGKSMGSAVSFGLEIIKVLLGPDAASKTEASIYRG